MKKLVLGFAASAAMLGIVDVASAADMPVFKARPAPRHDPCGVARFSGFYAGGNTGAVAYTAIRTDRDELLDDAADYSSNKIGFTAGVQVGYDWQSCEKVFGIVADWNWADTKATTRLFPNIPVADLRFENRMDWFSTIRARAGLAVNDTLFYVTGGIAAAKIKTTITTNFFNPALFDQHHVDDTRWGLVGGVGAEFALWNNWSLNTEVLYMQFQKQEVTVRDTVAGLRTFDFNDSAWVGRVGLNYRWDNPRAAYAASMPAGAPVYPCGPARFNGGYVGGNIGGISYTALRQDRDSFINDTGDFSSTKSGFTGGVQAGWDWQSCNRLLGVVADWNWTDVEARAIQNPNGVGIVDQSTKGQMDWFSTLRGRAGLVVDDTLIYVTGGLAAAKIESTYSNRTVGSSAAQDFSDTRWGLAVGVGAEFALWNGWALNTDLLYLQFKKGTDTFTPPGFTFPVSFEAHDSAWVSRIGLNYRWDNPRNAYAANYPVKGPVAAPCGPARYNGVYAGANVGAIRNTALRFDQDSYLVDNDQYTLTEGSVTAGGQIGFDWQSCHKVFGVVADWNWTDIDRKMQLLPNNPIVDLSIRTGMDWFSTLRTRSGLVVNDTLVYVTGGLAAAKIETTYTTRVAVAGINEQNSFSDTRWGWTGGAGAEYALAGGWSVNGEVLYMQFKRETNTFRSNAAGNNISFEANDSAWVTRVGMNYRWGGDYGKAPVVAKY